MATLMTEQVIKQYDDQGKASKAALYAVKNVTAGDDFNIGVDFSVVKRAVIVSATSAAAGVCTFVDTVITFPTGPNQDAVWLLVTGVDNYGP